MKIHLVLIQLVLTQFVLFAQPIPTGHWPLDGNANALIGVDAELFGPLPTKDRFGIIDAALSFNGTSDYIRLPDSLIHEKIPQTISVWIKTNVSGGLLGYQSALYPNPVTHHVPALYIGTSGKIRGKYWDGTTAAMEGTIVDDGHWHHIILRRTAVDQDLWVDGQLVASRNIAPFDLNMIRNYLGVCNSNNWPDSPNGYIYFQGCIDDFVVYGEALNQDEIGAIFEADLVVTDEPCHYCDSTNIAIGHDAYKDGAGAYNTILGNKAGQNISGSGNVLIGYGSDFVDTASHKYYLSNHLQKPLMIGDFKGGFLGLGTSDPDERLVIGAGKLKLLNTADFVVDGHSPGQRFHIRDDGRVTINTNDPGNFHLAVNGQIGATEITVEPGLWPDYVFEKNYTLTPLRELKEYIDEHKHLPGIPTSQQLERTGQSVGAIQRNLLEKIEELTLYVIELATGNAQLQIQIKDLEKKMEQLDHENR